MLTAYLHDKDVIEEMVKKNSRPKRQSPSLFMWTPEMDAIKDIQDQMIAMRGGRKFVPRPELPATVEMWRRKDAALESTVARLCGSD